jgi:hypothetical protein
MSKKLTSCKIDGLRVTEVTFNTMTGSCSAKVGLSVMDSPMAAATLQAVNTLPGVKDALDVLVEVIETAVCAKYGETEDLAEVPVFSPPPGIGDI